MLPSTAELRYTPSSTISETRHDYLLRLGYDRRHRRDHRRHDHQRRRHGLQHRHRHRLAHGRRRKHLRLRLYRRRQRRPAHQPPAGRPIRACPASSSNSSARASSAATATVLSASDGSYHFNNLAAGTYSVQVTQPSNYMEGTETVGTVGGVATGTAGQDQFQITQISLGAGGTGSEYNFGELGLQTSLISLRLLLASAPSAAQIIAEMDVAPAVYLSGSAAEQPGIPRRTRRAARQRTSPPPPPRSAPPTAPCSPR